MSCRPGALEMPIFSASAKSLSNLATSQTKAINDYAAFACGLLDLRLTHVLANPLLINGNDDASAAHAALAGLLGPDWASFSARSIATMLLKFIPTGFGLRALCFQRLKVVG